MIFRPCPVCKSKNVKFGWNHAKAVIDLFNPVRYGIAATIGSLGTTAAINVTQNLVHAFKYISSPLLQCTDCGVFIAQCPECREYLSFGLEYPKASSVYQCLDCKTEFRISENPSYC